MDFHYKDKMVSLVRWYIYIEMDPLQIIECIQHYSCDDTILLIRKGLRGFQPPNMLMSYGIVFRITSTLWLLKIVEIITATMFEAVLTSFDIKYTGFFVLQEFFLQFTLDSNLRKKISAWLPFHSANRSEISQKAGQYHCHGVSKMFASS